MKYRYNVRTGISKIKTKTSIALSTATLGFGGLMVVVALPLAAKAASATTTITPDNFNTVFNRTDVKPTSSYNFVSGPGTAPLGVGSLELTTADSTGKQQHLETQQLGSSISSVDAMGYSTYRHSDSTAASHLVPAINMEIFTNASGPNTGYSTLVFEPVYQSGGAAAVQPDQWQSWDAYNGGNAIWWSSRSIPGVCASDCFVSWADIVAANPGATIISYGVNQGSGNPGLHANVDALSIGLSGDVTTYDFEPYVVASTKDQCKNGGWQTYTDANGGKFKNQGDCVSYVATHGRNQSNG